MKLILVVISVFVQGAALAAGAPLAQVNRVNGLVRVARAGSLDQAQVTVGMTLAEGDRVTTISGRVEVRFADGHVLRLVENSTVDVMAPPRGKKGVFMRLVTGKMRALVARLSADESFQIQSSFAVASVKGTDLFFDGLIGSVRDEGDSTPHTLELTSLDGQTKLEIGEGMTGGFGADGSVIQPTLAGSGFFEALDQAFDVSGAPSGGSSSGSTPGGDTAGTSTPPPQAGDGGSSESGPAEGDTLRDELLGDLADFAASQDLGRESDTMEHAADAALGRSLVDIHGYRVRLEEHVMRLPDDPATIEIVALTSREAGPNAGISSFIDDLTFNAALPDNYEDIRRGLPAAFADPNVMPQWFPVSDTQVSRNPYGDQVRRQAIFGVPTPVFAEAVPSEPGVFAWTYSSEITQNGWGQSTDLQLFVGTMRAGALQENLREHFAYDHYGRMVGGWYSGCAPAAVYPDYSPFVGEPTMWASVGTTQMNGAPLYPVEMPDMDNPATTGINEAFPIFNNGQFGAGTRTTYRNALGGTTVETRYGGVGSPYLLMSTYLVSEDGTVLGGGVSGPSSAADAASQVDELAWEASDFADPAGGPARTVDVMVSPANYDANGWSPTETSDGGAAGAGPMQPQ